MSDIPMDQVVVRVKNLGPKDFRGQKAKYANVQYDIPAGTERFVPYLAAVRWFGDPQAMDNPQHPDDRSLQKRTLERERLSAFYGIYAQAWRERFNGETTPTDIDETKREVGGESYINGLHPNLPNVECWISKPEGDERLWTVIEDPEGVHVGGVNTGNRADDAEAIKKHLAAVEAQVARLQTQLAVAQPATAFDDVLEEDVAMDDEVPEPVALDDPQPDPETKGAVVDTPPGIRQARKKAAKVG